MENLDSTFNEFAIVFDNLEEDKLKLFYEKIDERIRNKEKEIILNMKNLSSINSSFLAKLLYFQKKTNKFNGKIIIFNLNENLKKIFLSLKFDEIFIIK